MTREFWKGATERALKTFVQTFIAVLGVTAGAVYTVDGVKSLPWASALITATVSAVLSLATSLGSPSFVAGPPAPSHHEPGLVEPASTESALIDPNDPGMIEPDDDAEPDPEAEILDGLDGDGEAAGSVAVPRHGEDPEE